MGSLPCQSARRCRRTRLIEQRTAACRRRHSGTDPAHRIAWRHFDIVGRHLAQARHPRIIRRRAPDREGEAPAGLQPAGEFGEGGRRIVVEHDAEARDQAVVRHSGGGAACQVRKRRRCALVAGLIGPAPPRSKPARCRSRALAAPRAPGAQWQGGPAAATADIGDSMRASSSSASISGRRRG